jgi:signal transduction histidine kinase
MIEAAKSFVKRHWPALRLRTILFAVLLFTAAMPGIGAVFLRVYENTLVRQTEAELVAQTAALASAAEILWPGAPPPVERPPVVTEPKYWRIYDRRIDLSRDPVLPERPPPRDADPSKVDPEALAVAARLGPMIDQTTRTTLASVLIVDRNGRVVRGVISGADYSHVAEVRTLLRGETMTTLRRNGDYQPRYSFEWLSRASALRVHYARPIIVDGEVVGGLLASRSARALFRGIYEDRGKIAIGVAVIFSILVFLAGLVAKGVAGPVERLSLASKDVAAGRGEIPPTPETAAIEIRQLYADFREMAETISVRSAYLRDFAAALSHEFKTPLAGIAGAVEILEDHYETMSEADRRRFLGNISADTRRLSQLVSRLLDLARADMASPDGEATTSFDDTARSIADALSIDGFRVRVDSSRLPPVAMPAASLETVLSTLVENSRQAGATQVEIRARKSAECVVATITDNGPGIPEADLPRVFEPFFTSRRAEGGSGLGLPIAKSLLTAARGQITAAKSDGGARFELRIPISR